MKRQTRSLGLAALCFAVGVSSACGSGSPGEAGAGATIKIGYAGGFTGMIEGFEKPALAGAQLAVEDINAAGGVDGRKLELLTADTQSDIDQGGPAAKKLLAKGVEAMLVTADYNFGGGAARVAQAAGKIVFSVGAGSPKFGVQGIGDLAYTMGSSGVGDGALTAEWAYEQRKARTAYVLLDDTTDYSKDQCRGFTTRWQELGGKILGQDSFKNSDTSISAQITRLKKAGGDPDVVSLCSYNPGGAVAVKQLRAAGVDSLIVTNNGMEGDLWFTESMPDLSDIALPVPASVWGDDPNGAIQDLVRRYADKVGKKPQNAFPVLAYAAVQSIAAAIDESGSTDGRAMAKVINAFGAKKFIIPVTFTPDVHIDTKRPARMLVISHGRYATEGVYEVKSSPPLFETR